MCGPVNTGKHRFYSYGRVAGYKQFYTARDPVEHVSVHQADDWLSSKISAGKRVFEGRMLYTSRPNLAYRRRVMDDYQAADVKYKGREYILKRIGILFVGIGGIVGLVEYGIRINKEIVFKTADIAGEESR